MNTSNIEIRQAAQEDAQLLVELSAKTFFDAYGFAHSKEDMDIYLTQTFNKEKMTGELVDKNVIFLIASFENNPVAYAKLTGAKTPQELKTRTVIELERIYVIKETIGKKIGTALMTKALEIARTKGYQAIWLAVWKFNPKAIAFYERFGFKHFGSDSFLLGSTKRALILMKKELA